jgi:lipoprotein-anchoring transpeptidase ErfK/SrfK
MRLLSCPTSMPRLVTASFLLAILAFPVSAGTAHTQSCAFLNWTAHASAPQTGLSAHTSGTASFVHSAPQDTAPSEAQAESAWPGPATAQPLDPAEPPVSKVLAVIDKSRQEMQVFVGDVKRYTWEVSTGLTGYDTPSGSYPARSMNEIWYSKEWDDAPMPHAIFFTKKGHAIHGTDEINKLNRPASHGCVRLAPENARTLYALVQEHGLENTEIVLKGDTPRAEPKVAGSKESKQQIKAQRTGKPVKKRVTQKPSAPSKLGKQRPSRPSPPDDRAYADLPEDEDFLGDPPPRRMGFFARRRMLREGLMSPDFIPPP